MNPRLIVTLLVLETKSMTDNSTAKTFGFDADAFYCLLATGTDKSFGLSTFLCPVM